MNQPDPPEITELRGVFTDGYTADDINHVFGLLYDVYGLTLVCRWKLHKDGWFQGHSEFYFQDPDGLYYYEKGDVYDWLNGTPGAPDSLGDLAQWRGAPVPDTDRMGPQHAVTHDGFHNCALVDKDL